MMCFNEAGSIEPSYTPDMASGIDSMSEQIEIMLPGADSETISEFWKRSGRPGFEMIAQLVMYQNRYFLKIRIVELRTRREYCQNFRRMKLSKER